MPKIYNRVENPELQFVILHRLPREYTVRVKGVKKFSADGLSPIAGDRSHGFPSRRIPKDGSNITTTVDGTGFKKKRGSVARPRKMVCRLVSSAELQRQTMDPELLAQRAEEARRVKWKLNRHNNNKSRRAHKRALAFKSISIGSRRGGLTRTEVSHSSYL